MVGDLSFNTEQCYCPGCEQVYGRMVEAAFANSRWAYRHEGCLVIYHDKCRHSRTASRQFMDGKYNRKGADNG